MIHLGGLESTKEAIVFRAGQNPQGFRNLGHIPKGPAGVDSCLEAFRVTLFEGGIPGVGPQAVPTFGTGARIRPYLRG